MMKRWVNQIIDEQIEAIKLHYLAEIIQLKTKLACFEDELDDLKKKQIEIIQGASKCYDLNAKLLMQNVDILEHLAKKGK